MIGSFRGKRGPRRDGRRGRLSRGSATCACGSLEAPEQGRVVVRRRLDLAGDPAEKVAVGHLDQALELGESSSERSPISASAKRPMIRSISRMPRCQARYRICLRRTSRSALRACRSAHGAAPVGRDSVATRAAWRLYNHLPPTCHPDSLNVLASFHSRSAVRPGQHPARRRAEDRPPAGPPARRARAGRRASRICCSTCRPAASPGS